jgi:MFS family permease
MADIFGRRWLTLFIVSMFTLGSGICGGATNGGMLIAGRAIQGMGGGGINMIIDVIIADLVPLRERPNYMAVVLTVYSVGTSLGPWVGGAIVDNASWRWVRAHF